MRDCNEEEVRGYRDALRRIHEAARKPAVSEETILDLHRRSRGRFKAVPGARVRGAMRDLASAWNDALEQGRLHPLLLLAAFNLDFLCIHPFRDGNGRVSRLLLLIQSYHFGFEVGRYISLERILVRELSPLHSQDGLPGVRGSPRSDRCAAR